MSSWYYAKDRERKGPVGEEELRRLAADGTLAPTDLVWRDGLAGWVAAGSAGLVGLFPGQGGAGVGDGESDEIDLGMSPEPHRPAAVVVDADATAATRPAVDDIPMARLASPATAARPAPRRPAPPPPRVSTSHPSPPRPGARPVIAAAAPAPGWARALLVTGAAIVLLLLVAIGLLVTSRGGKASSRQQAADEVSRGIADQAAEYRLRGIESQVAKLERGRQELEEAVKRASAAAASAHDDRSRRVYTDEQARERRWQQSLDDLRKQLAALQRPQGRQAFVVPRGTGVPAPQDDAQAGTAAARRARAAGAMFDDPAAARANRTPMVGGTGGSAVAMIAADDVPVVGFRYTLDEWEQKTIVRTIVPLWDRGPAAAANVAGSQVILAREGYVVGGVRACQDQYFRGFQVVFMRWADDRPRPGEQYTSDWIGFPQHGTPVALGGNGETVIGAFGRKGLNMDAFGLLLKK